jgi:hypothetical protein
VANYFNNRFWIFKKEKRRDIVSSEVVEKTRKQFGLNKNEMAKLLGLSNQHYTNCLNKKSFIAFRFYSAVDAIENQALKKAIRDIIFLHKIKTGLSIANIDDNGLVDDEDEINHQRID